MEYPNMEYPNPTGFVNVPYIKAYESCVGCKWRVQDSQACFEKTPLPEPGRISSCTKHTGKLERTKLLDWPKDA